MFDDPMKQIEKILNQCKSGNPEGQQTMQFDSEKLNLIGANQKLIMENRKFQQQLAQKDTIICQQQQ